MDYTSYSKKIDEYFELNTDNIIDDVSSLVSINSEKGLSMPGMPFGSGPYEALSKAKDIFVKNGLGNKIYGDCIIAADLTDLPSGLDILAHLDVVPAGPAWSVTEPFTPLVKDGRIYGRGTADDKGPAIAALYAMLCVRELGVPLKKNVRLILGTDEECGSGDLPHYYSKEVPAPMTISPDSAFPLTNVEKGRYLVEADGSFSSETLPCLISISVGSKGNVIPGEGEVVLRGFDSSALVKVIEAVSETTETKIVLNEENGKQYIKCCGEGGHAAFPYQANNALTAILGVLSALSFGDDEISSALNTISNLFPHNDYNGIAAHLGQRDEKTGELTISPDILTYENGKLYFAADCRFPLGVNEESFSFVKDRFEKSHLILRNPEMSCVHYVDPESDFVKTLLDVYTDVTGLTGEAMCSGGGTYVHDIPNGVAFGCEFPGTDNRIHSPDEFMVIEQLIESAKMFAKAIIRLCA